MVDRTFAQFLGILNEILSLVLPLLSFGAVALFFWGLAKFLGSGGNEDALKNGKSLMVWGVIGIFVIFSIWGIVGLLFSSIFDESLMGFPQLPTS